MFISVGYADIPEVTAVLADGGRPIVRWIRKGESILDSQ